jgi:hypothetical protein
MQSCQKIRHEICAEIPATELKKSSKPEKHWPQPTKNGRLRVDQGQSSDMEDWILPAGQ